ncbi:MAG: type II secretion system minor pseudopilin [Methylovirgula sp.]
MKRHESRNGFILVTVLWTIALLSAMAMAVSTSFRGFAGIVAIDHDRTKADALLNAGLAASADIVGRLGDRPLTERETIIALQTGSVRVHLSDDGGRIDINKAPVEVLSAVLRSIGAGDKADAIARSIVAWRMRDGAAPTQPDANPPASPTPDAAAAAAPQAAANDKAANGLQSFTDVRQLAQVPGISADDVAALLPLTTIFGDDKVNALTATSAVLAALPGINPVQIDELLAARRHPPIAEARLQQILGPAQKYFKIKARPIALAELTAQVVDGYTTAVRAVIVVLPDDTQPYRVLAWTPVHLSERRIAALSDGL